jgi:hypothetical protein
MNWRNVCILSPPGRPQSLSTSSMAKIDNEKVSEAVHDCLLRCYEKPADILPTIAGFLDKLEDGVGWNEDEIWSVEAGVRKVLIFGVLDGANYPGDATDRPVGDLPRSGSKSPTMNGV